ncbi:MAG: hypothetical protein WCC06_05830 [Candidatus Aminicenantales bacterium]
MNKPVSFLWLAAVAFLAAGGFAAFIYLFAFNINLYWMILSPIILALYQAPAIYLFWLWKRKRK